MNLNPISLAKSGVEKVGDVGKAVVRTSTKAVRRGADVVVDTSRAVGRGAVDGAAAAGKAVSNTMKSGVKAARNIGEGTVKVTKRAGEVVSTGVKKGGSALKTVGQQTAGFTKGVGLGAWDAVKGVGYLVSLSPTVGIPKSIIEGKGIQGYTQSIRDAGEGVKTIFTNPGEVWNAIKDPYVTDWKNGEYGSAIGRGAFEAVSLVIGAKGIDKVGKAGSIAGKAGTAGRAGNAANAAGKAGKAGQAAKAGKAGKVPNTPNVAGVSGGVRGSSTPMPATAGSPVNPGFKRTHRGYLINHDNYWSNSGGFWTKHKGVDVFIESSSSAPSPNVYRKFDEARRLIDNTPPDQIRRLDRFHILKGDNPFDDYWRKTYNNPNHVSAATGGQGGISYYRASNIGNQTSDLGLFHHEIGHVIGFDGGPNQYDLWRNAALSDRAHRGKLASKYKFNSLDSQRELTFSPNKIGVGKYADQELRATYRFTEDFAESNRLALASARDGAIATAKPKGIRGLFSSEKPVPFEQLFPQRSNLLRAFEHLRINGIDPSSHAARGLLEMWGFR